MKNGAKWRLKTVHSTKQRLISQIEALGASPYANNIWEKGFGIAIKVFDVPSGAANIIKQEALASGADAAVARGSVNCSVAQTDLLLVGNVKSLGIVAERLKRQGFSLPFLAAELEELISGERSSALFVCGRELNLSKPIVMGIVNLTPDSFSDGGKYCGEDAFIARVRQIFEEGGVIADIGAVSTKPGHELCTEEEEINRLKGRVCKAKKIAEEYGGFVSIDSFRAKPSELALSEGAEILNVQYPYEAGILELCKQYQTGLILMHFKDVVGAGTAMIDKVADFLLAKAKEAENIGIDRRSICLDPGFGFGKSVDENYYILQYLSELCSLGYPLLAGLSRKRMIGAAVGREAAHRQAGTLAAELLSAQSGAAIIRTHDVEPICDALKVLECSTGNI